MVRAALGLALFSCGTDAAPSDEARSPAREDAGVPRLVPAVHELSDREAVASGSPSCKPAPGRCAEFGSERPERLSEHSAVYDDANRSMLVFGGTSSVPVDCAPVEVEFSDALWIYDDPCGRWRKLEGRGPSPRARHMAAFGAARMWLFGGRFREGASGYYQIYYDLWAFDPASSEWQLMPTRGLRPTARVNGGLAFDELRQRVWLMGGNQGEHLPAYVPTNDVWSYSLEAEVWEQHDDVSVGPSPRFFHAVAIDPVRDRLVVFGGTDADGIHEGAGYFSDLWALDLEQLTWTELTPEGARPDGRFWSQLAYDVEDDSYLLFGGHDDGALGNRNDTWRFDPESGQWSNSGVEDEFRAAATDACSLPVDFARVQTELPERRHSHTLVWSAECGHALLFGGKTDCGASDDVWRFAGDRWNVRSPAREGEACPRWADDPDACGTLCD